MDFESLWDAGNLASIALLAAMKTNKTVRNLCVDSLEEPHLTAIVAGAGEFPPPFENARRSSRNRI